MNVGISSKQANTRAFLIAACLFDVVQSSIRSDPTHESKRPNIRLA